jgi:hypothetical protein
MRRIVMRSRPRPATVIATVALFFALGGSAYAVQDAIKPQARCSTGAIRGIATVTGDTLKGIANMPDQFSNAKQYFARAFNCTGGSIAARRVSASVYEVQFSGNPAATALVTAYGTASGVQPLGGGVFRVTLNPGREPMEVPFTIVVI